MASERPYRSFSAGDLVLSYDPWIWALASRDEYNRYCAFCFTERQDLRTCSKCKLHRYCDAKCQMADWKQEHKVECALLGSVDTSTNMVHPSNEHPIMAVVLTSKIALKLQRSTRDNLHELGEKTAREILDSLPTYPEKEKFRSFFEFKALEKTHPKPLSPASQLRKEAVLKVIEHNAFPILNPGTKDKVIGAAIIPQASFRAMTPVCWDSNVMLDFRGRKFVVHATEDITQYTGLNDLRHSELLDDPSFLTPTERRRLFQEIYHRPCDCRKCTPAYEAEINPLKCVTPGCTERIPSDERALVPCQQCGAICNPERLQQFKRLVNKLENIRKGSWLNGTREEAEYAAETVLRKEIDSTGILHSDAHIRFLVGWHGIADYTRQGRCVEAWELCKGLIGCVREIIPRCHILRADFLMEAGLCVGRFLRKLRDMEKDAVTKQEALRLLTDLFDNSAMCSDFYKEAGAIYSRIYGEDTKQASDAWQCHEFVEEAKHEMAGVIRQSLQLTEHVTVTKRSSEVR